MCAHVHSRTPGIDWILGNQIRDRIHRRHRQPIVCRYFTGLFHLTKMAQYVRIVGPRFVLHTVAGVVAVNLERILIEGSCLSVLPQLFVAFTDVLVVVCQIVRVVPLVRPLCQIQVVEWLSHTLLTQNTDRRDCRAVGRHL